MEPESKNRFPRTNLHPTQSSKYWVKEKDRYLRQLLISDIEAETGRNLLVYFSMGDEITHLDAEDFYEVISGVNNKNEFDLMIQTPGGGVEAVEKYISVIKHYLGKYRAIVPNFAKSGGTTICLASNEILLGPNSELGPIDPQISIRGVGSVPCEFAAQDGTLLPSVRAVAFNAHEGAKKAAKRYLEEGMLKGKEEKVVENIVKKISSPTSWSSHGSVIDFSEAEHMGLTVKLLKSDDALWQKIWLLYCMYRFDMKAAGFVKIQEGSRYSIAREKSPSSS